MKLIIKKTTRKDGDKNTQLKILIMTKTPFFNHFLSIFCPFFGEPLLTHSKWDIRKKLYTEG